jgi:hypothetical protein
MRILVSIALLAALGCAPRTQRISPWDIPASPTAAVLVRECSSDRSGTQLRHIVRLSIPGNDLDQTFNGIMRFDSTGQTMRLIGMAGFGLKLFDLTVRPEALETHFLHPGLGRVHDMPERIAFCVRRIWLGPPPSYREGVERHGGKTLLLDKHEGVLLEHTFTGQTLTATRARGPRESWTISYPDRTANDREPRTIVFTDGRGRYELHIRLVGEGATQQ